MEYNHEVLALNIPTYDQGGIELGKRLVFIKDTDAEGVQWPGLDLQMSSQATNGWELLGGVFGN
jgi:hypothetical protein